MTLTAYLITLRGRIREALCSELALLRHENNVLRMEINHKRDRLRELRDEVEYQQAYIVRLMDECDELRKGQR